MSAKCGKLRSKIWNKRKKVSKSLVYDHGYQPRSSSDLRLPHYFNNALGILFQGPIYAIVRSRN